MKIKKVIALVGIPAVVTSVTFSYSLTSCDNKGPQFELPSIENGYSFVKSGDAKGECHTVYYDSDEHYNSDDKILNLDSQGITRLKLGTGETNSELIELHCSENELTSLDISNNIALTQIFCGYNKLTSLDISKNIALEGLFCSMNKLTVLDTHLNIALNRLECGSNQIKKLEMSKNIDLNILSCYQNQLTSLNVSFNTALTQLWCEENKLVEMDLTHNTALLSSMVYNNKNLNSVRLPAYQTPSTIELRVDHCASTGSIYSKLDTTINGDIPNGWVIVNY